MLSSMPLLLFLFFSKMFYIFHMIATPIEPLIGCRALFFVPMLIVVVQSE